MFRKYLLYKYQCIFTQRLRCLGPCYTMLGEQNIESFAEQTAGYESQIQLWSSISKALQSTALSRSFNAVTTVE
jgi:hypothetical protein